MGTASDNTIGPAALAAIPQSITPPPLHHRLDTLDLFRLAVVGVGGVLSWEGLTVKAGGFDIVAVGAALIGGYPVYREAVENIAARRMTMELSMTIALAAAMAIGEFSTALFILFFVLIAEWLEGLTTIRGRRAIHSLLELLPRRATVRRDGRSLEIPVEELREGDTVIVKPGSEIPVDGVVVRGSSMVDQASITGESAPVQKVPGADVFAGTTNHDGALEVRTTQVGRETVFGRIIDAVEEAETSRAPVQKLADRLSAGLVYFALAAAGLTFLLTHNVRSTIAVIIVAGACGIAAGTPLAMLGAIGRAARSGAIVKGGRYMEALGTVDTIVLDKTGTLTFGEPEVAGIHTSAGVDARTALEIAAIAESPSEHALARAILRKAAEIEAHVREPDTFEYIPGKGVRCGWNGNRIAVGNRLLIADEDGLQTQPGGFAQEAESTLVSFNGRLIGSISIADRLRPEAVEAVARLHTMGLRTVLLSGDHRGVTADIARQLQVAEFAAELLPEDKLARVEELMRAGRRVAMVGDGINDAPALARATVGIAMGSGTGLARETSSVLLLGNNLLDLVSLVATARRARGIILFNFAGTLAVDAAGVALAALGLLSPLLAALLHVSSELAFILNSARLIPAPGRTPAPGI